MKTWGKPIKSVCYGRRYLLCLNYKLSCMKRKKIFFVDF